MKTSDTHFSVWFVLFILACSLVPFFVAPTGCGPVSVQIKQEQWRCEARHDGANGSVTFEGCKRDGTGTQTTNQPDSGPDVSVEPPEVSALMN